MAFNKKYAGLPDLVSLQYDIYGSTTDPVFQDPAPDIYETPDLTDEASTVPVSPSIPCYENRMSPN